MVGQGQGQGCPMVIVFYPERVPEAVAYCWNSNIYSH